MRLDKLVLHGFKSFADKTVFEFPKNFTAIVGPNGSGKSNIADAIRWVLGEQSMKTLRSKSSHDVIFGGSDQLSRLGMAQVELHLDNRDHKLPLDYNEVVISRKIFRSGESEYRVNNAQVRLQDIILMLAQAKFGQKSYAVIGQGMITHFLNATPQERKIFLDEATGVREFQIKRDQAINKLIRTEEHLVQGEVLLTEIEPHLQSLTRQVKRLEKREKLETELRALQIQYYGSLWNELTAEHHTLKTELAQQQTTTQQLESDLATAQTASDAISQEASRGERYQQLQQQFNELLEHKSFLLKEQAVLKGKLELEHQKQGELSLVWMKRKEDEILKDIQEQAGSVQLLEEQMHREQNELARAEKNVESLKNEFREQEYNILKLKEQIETRSHAMTIPEIQTELQNLFAQQQDFLRQLLQTKSLEEFKSVQSHGKRLTQQFAEFMDRLHAEEKDAVEALRVEMKHQEQLLERLVQERDTAQHQLNELRVSIESCRAKVQMLHTQIRRGEDELATIQSDITAASAEKESNEAQDQIKRQHETLNELEGQIAHDDTKLNAVRANIDQFNQEEEEKKTRLVSIQSDIRTLQRKLTAIRQQANSIEIHIARIETRREDVQNTITRALPSESIDAIYHYTGEPLTARHAAEEKMASLSRQLESIGSIDPEMMKEYEETKERFDFLQKQTTDLSTAIISLEKIIDELDKTIHAQFQKNFKRINEHFQKYFTVLFGGGAAKLLMLTDTEEENVDATDTVVSDGATESIQQEKERELIGKKKKRQKVISGIDVMASPAGKKITNVTALSGGEKSLISIALLCAIIAHNPSPFVVLDEVEAALDEENSEKLAAIISELSHKTQIVIITHNRVTMRAADILYGVTVGKEGKSHILSVELTEAEELVQE
ncbi:MAG: AAA family ATPase [Candidatus Kerfeldbacteria bacterium]|nr:AAA family ATPase [Candidatus Kerfeldbacteria bacterium]